MADVKPDVSWVELIVNPEVLEKPAPTLVCLHCSKPTSYIPVKFVYKRCRRLGYIFYAMVKAHVCDTCHSWFYMPEVDREITRELYRAKEKLGIA